MRITVTGHKGGVGKTVTSIHLAAYLSRTFGEGSTVLIDGDPNRSASEWGTKGLLPFPVVGPKEGGALMREREHAILDTQGRPSRDVLEGLARRCDLLVIPSTPDPLAIRALMLMVADLRSVGEDVAPYRVLLTRVPAWPRRSGAKARAAFEAQGVPLFDGQIRDRVAFEKAALAGIPVYEADDRRATQGWEDYEKVGKELIR